MFLIGAILSTLILWLIITLALPQKERFFIKPEDSALDLFASNLNKKGKPYE